MTVKRERVGEILKLERRAVTVDPSGTYEEIGVRSFGRGIFHKEPISGIDLGSKRVFRIQPGDLVISNVFAWEGAIAVATEAEAGKIGSHRFMTFIPTEDRIDTSWAAWYFRSEPGLELIRQASPGSAGRNRTLAIDRFQALEIPLPSIDEQTNVANHLTTLQQIVTQEIDPRTVVNESLLESITDARLQQLLAELRTRTPAPVPLSNLGTWSSGGTPSAREPSYYGGGIPWAVIGDLNGGPVVTTERTLTQLGVEQSSAKIVPPGTVLVAMYGSIGKLGVAGVPLATNQAIATCKPSAGVSSEFLMSLLRCLRMELVKLGQGGAQQNISQGLLKSVLVPKPEPAGQQEFVARVNQHLVGIGRIRQVMRRRCELADSLIPAALNQEFASLN